MGTTYNIFKKSVKKYSLKIYFDFKIIFKKQRATAKDFLKFMNSYPHSDIGNLYFFNSGNQTAYLDELIDDSQYGDLIERLKDYEIHNTHDFFNLIVYDDISEQFYLQMKVNECMISKAEPLWTKASKINLDDARVEIDQSFEILDTITNQDVPIDLLSRVIQILTIFEELIQVLFYSRFINLRIFS